MLAHAPFFGPWLDVLCSGDLVSDGVDPQQVLAMLDIPRLFGAGLSWLSHAAKR